MEGITRAKAHKPRERKPLLLDGLRKLVMAIDAPYPVNLRDRAIMLVAYFGLLRRSELVSLMIEQAFSIIHTSAQPCISRFHNSLGTISNLKFAKDVGYVIAYSLAA